MTKHKKPNKQQMLAKAQKQLDRVLNKTGYFAAKAKHGKATINRFPDLSVDTSNLPTLSNTIGNGFVVKTGAHHPDAIQFPVGNDHKSGMRLIVATDDLRYTAGKKT